MTLTQISSRGVEDTLRWSLGASGTDHYTFTGPGLTGTVNDPTIYLSRGQTYVFENNSGGHPFQIQSVAGSGGSAYNTGVTNNGGGNGTEIKITVPHDAPDILYYQCTSHANMGGQFSVAGSVAAGSITTAKLADDAVDADKLANSINSAIAANTAKDLTALSATNLTSGTVPDARFPATLPAVSGANLTNLPAANLTGTIADARISASSVTQHATSFDDNNIINDISALALKINALQNATRYNTNSLFVETFQDENGIASKTNAVRNGNEYMTTINSKNFYKPNQDRWLFSQSATNVATNGPCTFVAWMRSANGSNWTYNGSQGGGIMNLQTKDDTSKYLVYNIGYGSNNGKFGAHTPGVSDTNTTNAWSAPTNKWVMGVVRTGYNWSTGHVEIMHRAYDAGNFTTDADSNGGTANYGTLAFGTGKLFMHNSNSYTGDYDNTYIAHMGFWNVSLNGNQLDDLFNGGEIFDWNTNNGNYNASGNLQEYFKMDEGSGTTLTNSGNGGNATRSTGSGAWDSDGSQIGSASATGNFISNTITAPSSTNKIGVLITYVDGFGAATVNTDLKVYLSADNGSNYTQVTLVNLPNFATGVSMAVANDVNVTAGTQLKYKVEFANQSAGSKETRLTGVSLQY